MRPCSSDHALDRGRHLGGVERVGHQPVGAAARGADGAHRLIQDLLVDLDDDDRPALAGDDLGRRPSDAAARGGDQRDPSLESHAILLAHSRRSLTLGAAACLVNSLLLRSRP